MITPAEFEDKMRSVDDDIFDTEDKHIEADKLMCAVLRDLGYVKGIEIFEQMSKWYG